MEKVNREIIGIVAALLCLVALLLSKSAIITAGGESSSDWPMYRHDAERSGFTPVVGPKYNFTKWTFQTGDIVLSSPAVANGMVYFGSNDSKVYALDMWTGGLIWSFSTGSAGIYSSPAVAYGIVYIGANDNKTYALNAITGELIWSFTAFGSAYFGLRSPFWSSPVVVDGTVYIGNLDSFVYALDAATGSLKWAQTVYGSCTGSSPAVVDGKVYIASAGYTSPYNGNVTCLDAATGQLIWYYTIPYGVWFSTPAVVNGIVYVGSFAGFVYALNATTGQLIAYFAPGDFQPINTSPAVANGIVYVGSGNGRIYALNASNLKVIWSKMLSSSGVYSSPVVAGDTVYIGTEDGRIFALDAKTGQEIWVYTTGGRIRGSFAVVSGPPQCSSLLYAPSYDGKIYAIYDVIHDIAVTNVLPLKTIIGQGYSMKIKATIENQGNYTETFNVTLYANTTEIETINITLQSGESVAITFKWNTTGFSKGYYRLRVYAWPVQGEADENDNTFINGLVKVGVPGDVNNDRKVDMTDIGMILRAYGTTPMSPNWNPNYDLNDDGKVDMTDVGIALRNYGKTE